MIRWTRSWPRCREREIVAFCRGSSERPGAGTFPDVAAVTARPGAEGVKVKAAMRSATARQSISIRVSRCCAPCADEFNATHDLAKLGEPLARLRYRASTHE